MNAALGGSNSASDQIIINGGKATGSTLLDDQECRAESAARPGHWHPPRHRDQRRDDAVDAFSLANTPMVGGYKYSLEETDDSCFLVSSPTGRRRGDQLGQ